MGESGNENKSLMTMEQKAGELRSSGYVLIAVGSVGLLAVILALSGVFSISLQGVMKYISGGVMGFLFLVFLLSGFGALKRSKKAALDAGREKEKRDEILKWFLSEYDAEKIDESLTGPEEEENTKGETEEVSGDETEESSGEETEEKSGDEAEESSEDEEETEEDEEEEYAGALTDENEKYFERTAFMRERISERFLELDEALLSDITDRLYTEIFG